MSYDFVRRCLRPDLPVRGVPHVVLLALASHANEQGECYPSVALLAAEARVKERAAQTALRTLERAGLVRVRKDAQGKRIPGPFGCNVYCLTLPDEGASPCAPKRTRPRGPSGFHDAPGGAPACAPGRTAMQVHDDAPRAHGQAAGGAPPRLDGAHNAAPKASEKPQEADAAERATASADEVIVIEDLDELDPDADFPARLEAVIRRGGFTAMHGRDIRGEWVVPTRGHTPAQVAANMLRWAVAVPSAYAERRRAEEGEAAARANEARRAAVAPRIAAVTGVTDQVDRLAKRLLGWLRADPEGQEVGRVVAKDRRMREALDLMRSGREGNLFGQRRLVDALSGRPRDLIDRFIAAQSEAEVSAAAVSG